MTETERGDFWPKAKCTFVSEGWLCEDCRKTIHINEPIYWFSDGGYEPRDGTYVCEKCAHRYAGNGGITP